MASHYILRKEVFGAIRYDRNKLRHTFIPKGDLLPVASITGIEQWDSDLTDAPKDLIFSPIRVYFELTRRCNLSCRNCFNSSGRALSNELTTQEVIRTIYGLRQDKVIDIRFTGGELTLREGWFEILDCAVQQGNVVSINTHGVFEDDTTIDKLAQLDLDQITVSLDGAKKHHEYMRGKGTFDRVIQTLQVLKRKGVRLRVNTVLTKGSARDIEEILGIVSDYVSEINFFYMRPTGRATRIKNQMLSYAELYRANRHIESLRSEFPHINILHGVQVVQNNSIQKNLEKLGLRMGGPDGFTRFNIFSDGSMWAGGYMPFLNRQLQLGNIKKEGYSLLQVWRHSPILEQFRKKSEKQQKICQTCSELNARCGGADLEMEIYREFNSKRKNPYCIRK